MDGDEPTDPGLDSGEDLRMLTRLLIAGLVGMVIVAAVVLVLSGNWSLVALVLGGYLIIAVMQWSAAAQRVRRTRAEMARRGQL